MRQGAGSEPRSLPLPHEPLVAALVAVAVGMVVDRWWPLPLPVYLAAGLGAWLSWGLLWRADCDRLAVAPLWLCLALCGGAWHHCRWRLFDADELGLAARATSGPVCLRADVLLGPRRLPAPPADPLRAIQIGDRTRLELGAVQVRHADRWLPCGGRLTLLVDGHVAGVSAGDHVQVFGQLAAARPRANAGEFDFAAHERGHRRLCLVRSGFPDCVEVVATGSAWNPRRWVDRLRSGGQQSLRTYLGEPRQGLASAMFLGLREELDPDHSQAFLETGTVHLLVISGLNVGILAGCLLLLLRLGLVRQRAALICVAVLTVLYAVVTDLQPPVVRATVMVAVLCLGRALGRPALGLNTLAGAALLVLVLSPAELFVAGTQLSFLSVAAMVAWGRRPPAPSDADPLEQLIAATRPWPIRAARAAFGWLWQGAAVSGVVWLVVLPLVMERFHLASPAAVALGPLLAVPVAVAMAAGFGVLLAGPFLPPLAAALGWVCDANLAILEGAVLAARSIPGSHFWTSGPALWWIVVCYAGLSAWLLLPRLRPPRRWCWGILLGWIGLGLVAAWWPSRSGELRCSFLAVGHGCSVVAELPDGRTLLYDAGQLGSPVSAARSVAGHLWSRGIGHLDAVVLSHADVDHYNALPALLKQFSVGVVYVSPAMFDQPGPALDQLRQALDGSGVPVRVLASGDRLSGGACRIEVLHPPPQGVPGSDNAHSLVLALEHQGRRVLLTGDLESPGLDEVLSDPPWPCDVLLAPHHGSAQSNPPGMALWSTPRWVVVSGGVRERAEEVIAAYTARGGQVLFTADVGTVEALLGKEGVEVRTFRSFR